MLKNNKIQLFLAAVFLLFLCLITYGDTLTHQFMIDERIYVKPAATIFSHFRTFGDFFTKPIGHHYVPLLQLLNIGLFSLFQNPFPLYLINLILFYINCGLLFVFIYLISQSFLTALLTSIIFCIHPMTGDNLQHISSDFNFMQTIFIELGLISLYLYAKQNRHIFYYFFSLFMIALALLCHEIILVFPLYAAALLFFLTDLKFKRILKLTIPFIVLSLLLIIVWLGLVNPRVRVESIETLHPNSFWTLSANFSHLFFWYLSNLFVPRSIVFMYTIAPLQNAFMSWNFLLFGFLTGCGLLIFCCFKKSLESFALVLFLIGLIYTIPASQTQLGMGQIYEPNWVYFSSVGFFLFIVLILLKLRKYISKPLFIIFVSVLFMFYFIATLKFNIRSRTEISYCEYWLRKSPGNFIAREIVASYYYYHKDLVIPSDLIGDISDQVDVYIKGGDPVALGLIERISSSPISSTQRKDLLNKLAVYYCKNGPKDKCEETIGRIIGPKKGPYSYMELSNAFYQWGVDGPAIALLRQCISLYPKYKEPYLLMGVILGNEDHYKESIYYWDKGLALDPSDSRFAADIEEAKALINQSQRKQ